MAITNTLYLTVTLYVQDRYDPRTAVGTQQAITNTKRSLAMLQKPNATLNDQHDALTSANSALAIQNQQLSTDVDVLSRPRSAGLALEN